MVRSLNNLPPLQKKAIQAAIDEASIGGPGGAVDSVNGQTGVVVLETGDLNESTDSNYVSDAQLTIIGNTSGTNTGDQLTFKTIAVSGQSDVVADTITDTLTLAAGSNITITTNATTDTVTITGTGSGSGDVVGPSSATDNAITRFDSTTGKLIQDSGVTVSDASGGTNLITVTGTGALTVASGGDGLNMKVQASTGTTNNSSGGNVQLVGGAGSASGSGDGGDITLTAGAATGVAGAGGDVTLTAGAGAGNGGGNVTVSAGAASASGTAGIVSWLAGAGSAAGGDGGAVSVRAGSATASNGSGGDIKLRPGIQQGAGTVGRVTLLKASSTSIGAVLDTETIATSAKTFTFPNTTGGLVINASTSVDNAIARFDSTTGQIVQNSGLLINDLTGNDIHIVTANAATPNNIAIHPGTPSGSSGGSSANFSGGSATTSGNGGAVTIQGGASAGANTAGVAKLQGGLSSAGAGGVGGAAQVYGGAGDDGGDVDIHGGITVGSGTGGDVFIYGGDSASGTDGHVILGNPGMVGIQQIGSSLEALLDAGSIASTNKTFTFPNVTGTFSLVTGDGLKLTDTVLTSSFTIPANTAAYVPGGLEIGATATLTIVGILEIG